MVEIKSSNTKYIIIAFVLGLLLVSFIFAGFIGGNKGIGDLMGVYFKFLFFAIAVGIVLGVFWLLFFWEKRIDAPYEVSRDITAETKENRPSSLKKLYVRGDKKHPPKCYGKIVGWSSRQNMKKYDEEDNKYYTRESIFLVEPSFFRRIIVRCPEEKHDSLHGDIYIDDVGLVKHKYFYYPSSLHTDFSTIDTTQWEEAKRWVFLDMPSLFHALLKRGSGIMQKDEKSIESKTGIEVIKENTGGGGQK